MENPIKMDDLGVNPTIFGNTHVAIVFSRQTKMLRQLRGFEVHLSGVDGFPKDVDGRISEKIPEETADL